MNKATPIQRPTQQQHQQQMPPSENDIVAEIISEIKSSETNTPAPPERMQQRATSIANMRSQQPQQSRQPHRQQTVQEEPVVMRRPKVQEKMQDPVQEKNQSSLIYEDEDEEDDDNSLDSYEVEKKTSKQKNFLSKEDVEEGDLEETKGIYQKILSFFSKDTKEPLIICALVFLMCLPFVNQMLTKYVPFLVKDGNLGMGAIATKAIVAGVLFFVVKKFL